MSYKNRFDSTSAIFITWYLALNSLIIILNILREGGRER